MKSSDINQIAVIGAGTMGAGIAGVFARAGCEVRLVDQTEAILQRGMEMLAAAQEGLRAARVISAKEARAALRRVQTTTAIEDACPGVQLAIESISEDLQRKQEVFKRLDALCPARTVLASNTSGLSITAIAEAVRRPQRVAGMHFWNPPHLVPLVEIIRGEKTSAGTAKLLVDLSRRLGKRPVLVRRDVPGFVGNRLQFAVLREALHLLESGVASAEDIDTAMTAGPGLRYGLLGPLRTADLGGVDVFLAISEYLFAELSSQRGPSPVLAELVAKGRRGVKAGGGFYDYAPPDARRLLEKRDRILLGFLRVLEENRE